MAGGLHYDSLMDLPPSLRAQVAAQMARPAAQTVQSPEPEQQRAPKAAKYHNIKTQVAGLTFDSQKEARRYRLLMQAREKGIIQDLRLQRDYTLQEAYTTPEGERIRAIRYKADFTYRISPEAAQRIESSRMMYLWFSLQDRDFWARHPGTEIIEDVKSRPTRTKEYIIKKKMMADLGHQIREV